MVKIAVIDLEGVNFKNQIWIKKGAVLVRDTDDDNYFNDFTFFIKTPPMIVMPPGFSKSFWFCEQLCGFKWRDDYNAGEYAIDFKDARREVIKMLKGCIVFAKGISLEERFLNGDNVNGYRYQHIADRYIKINDINKILRCKSYDEYFQESPLGKIQITNGWMLERRVIGKQDHKKKEKGWFLPFHVPRLEISYFMDHVINNKLWENI